MSFPRIQARRVDGYCQDLKWGPVLGLFFYGEIKSGVLRGGKKVVPVFFLGDELNTLASYN